MNVCWRLSRISHVNLQKSDQISQIRFTSCYREFQLVEKAMQTLKNLRKANMVRVIDLTENVNQALRLVRFLKHTELNRTAFELHHGRKPGTDLLSLVLDGKTKSIDLIRQNCLI